MHRLCFAIKIPRGGKNNYKSIAVTGSGSSGIKLEFQRRKARTRACLVPFIWHCLTTEDVNLFVFIKRRGRAV